MKEGFLKTVKVVTFAAGVLTVLTGCSLEDNLTNEPIKPEAIVLPRTGIYQRKPHGTAV